MLHRQRTSLSIRHSLVEEYRQRVCIALARIYPMNRVTPEWISLRDEIGLYSPRLDIAVGPFAFRTRYIEDYDELMDNSRIFIEKMMNCHITNVRDYDESGYNLSYEELKEKNRNSRCLLAIEIENTTGAKYIIGSVVNACALGRIGIFIAWNHEKLKSAIKLRKYLEFLARVGKNTFDTTNLLILEKDQFFRCVNGD